MEAMGMYTEMGKMILLTGNLLLAGALFFKFYRWQKKNGYGVGGNRTGVLLMQGVEWLLEFAVYGAGMITITDIIIKGIEASESGDTALSVVGVMVAESMMLIFLICKTLHFMREKDESGLEADPCCGGGRYGAFQVKGEVQETPVVSNRESVEEFHVKGKGKRQEMPAADNGGSRRVSPGKVCGGMVNGEFMLGMLLLLGLTLRGWREPDTGRALAGQLLYFALFFVYEYLGEKRKSARQPAFRDNIPEEGLRQEEYLKNVEQQYQRTRELWHDLKNHIKVLEILAEEERYGELTDYLGSFKRDVEHRMVPVRTGCAAVDALLGDKLYHAGQQGAEMSLQLCDLSGMRIQELDLCTILGNLLDNALEACSGLQGAKRIGLRMRREENFYYITIVNSAKEPLRQGEGLLSGKHDRDNGVGHGLGLRSAERTAHRYGGLLVTEYSDGEFRVVVRLQADEQDAK